MPVLAVIAWHRSRNDVKRFAIGAVAGLLPLIVLSWSVPWWRFATVHARRGLEAESLWASAIWLSHFVGVPATWEMVTAWFEVTGPVAEGLVTPARIVWATATFGSVALATWAAWRQMRSSGEDADTASLSVTATLLLLPVTTFVAFSLVLSPQFHLWLAPLAALSLLGRRRPDAGVHWRPVVHLLQYVPGARFFPESDVRRRSRLGRTLVLVLRNVLLLYAAWSLVKTAVRLASTQRT